MEELNRMPVEELFSRLTGVLGLDPRHMVRFPSPLPSPLHAPRLPAGGHADMRTDTRADTRARACPQEELLKHDSFAVGLLRSFWQLLLPPDVMAKAPCPHLTPSCPPR